MTITVQGTIENGQLKLAEPVQFAEGTPVCVTITPTEQFDDPLAAVIGIGDSGRTDGAANHDKYIYGKLRP